MSFRGDDRGQTVQIGAVLLFATLVIMASLYQAAVVPAENEKVEFTAYQDATSDMTELRNAVLSASSGGDTQAATVKTGAQYPSRVFFFNSLDPKGTLETSEPGNVTIRNASASPSQFQNVGKYLDAAGQTLEYPTRRVRFTPDYSHISPASLVLSNGFLYRAHDQPTPVTSQTLVHGNTITVRTVVGDLSATGYAVPVTAVPVSRNVNTISVTNTNGDRLTLTVPTQLNATEWEDTVLSGQTGVNVADVRPGPRPNTVTVVMEPGETYELRVSRVELKERNDDPTAADPPVRYLVSQTDRNVRTNGNGRIKLVVEARDTLNNPASNQQVTFSSPSGKFETQSGKNLSESPTLRTNEAGEAIVYYNGTDYLGTLDVTAKLGTGGSVPPEKRVEWDVTNTVTSTGGGQSGEQAGRTLVVLEGTSTSADTDTFTFTIKNRGSTAVNMTGYRLDYITKLASNGQITDGPNAITSISFPGLSESRPGISTEGQSPHFFSDSISLPPGQSLDMEVTFDQAYHLGNKDSLLISNSIYVEGGVTATFTTFYINN